MEKRLALELQAGAHKALVSNVSRAEHHYEPDQSDIAVFRYASGKGPGERSGRSSD